VTEVAADVALWLLEKLGLFLKFSDRACDDALLLILLLLLLLLLSPFRIDGEVVVIVFEDELEDAATTAADIGLYLLPSPNRLPENLLQASWQID